MWHIHSKNEPSYTDTCVVVGPTYQWAHDGMVDLARVHPEVFLGYRVYRASVHVGSALRPSPNKVVILVKTPHPLTQYRMGDEYNRVCLMALEGFTGSHVEVWYVHRTNNGIVAERLEV
jgi:hypothetical protein